MLEHVTQRVRGWVLRQGARPVLAPATDPATDAAPSECGAHRNDSPLAIVATHPPADRSTDSAEIVALDAVRAARSREHAAEQRDPFDPPQNASPLNVWDAPARFAHWFMLIDIAENSAEPEGFFVCHEVHRQWDYWRGVVDDGADVWIDDTRFWKRMHDLGFTKGGYRQRVLSGREDEGKVRAATLHAPWRQGDWADLLDPARQQKEAV